MRLSSSFMTFLEVFCLIKSIKVFSQRGRKNLNEDTYVANEKNGLFAIFDGATSISSYQKEKGFTGGYLASHLFQQHFSNLTDFISPKNEMIIANEKLKKAMVDSHIDISNPSEWWCTAGVVLKVTDSTFQFAQVADCMLIGFKKTGGYTLLTQNTLEGIDNRLKEKRKKERFLGIAVESEDYYQNTIHAYQYMRTTANTSGGYSVANGDDKMNDFIQYGSGNINDYSHLVLISDGLFYPDQTHVNPWDIFYEHVKTKGMKSYMEHITSFETSYRLVDDKTAIVISFT